MLEFLQSMIWKWLEYFSITVIKKLGWYKILAKQQAEWL